GVVRAVVVLRPHRFEPIAREGYLPRQRADTLPRGAQSLFRRLRRRVGSDERLRVRQRATKLRQLLRGKGEALGGAPALASAPPAGCGGKARSERPSSSAARVAAVSNRGAPTAFVNASPREARLTVPPMAVHSARPGLPMEPTTVRPVLIPIPICSGA